MTSERMQECKRLAKKLVEESESLQYALKSSLMYSRVCGSAVDCMRDASNLLYLILTDAHRKKKHEEN